MRQLQWPALILTVVAIWMATCRHPQTPTPAPLASPEAVVVANTPPAPSPAPPRIAAPTLSKKFVDPFRRPNLPPPLTRAEREALFQATILVTLPAPPVAPCGAAATLRDTARLPRGGGTL